VDFDANENLRSQRGQVTKLRRATSRASTSSRARGRITNTTRGTGWLINRSGLRREWESAVKEKGRRRRSDDLRVETDGSSRAGWHWKTRTPYPRGPVECLCDFCNDLVGRKARVGGAKIAFVIRW